MSPNHQYAELARVIVGRHGAYNESDLLLNGEGRAQSAALGEKIKSLGPGKVFLLCSSAPRALATAEEIGKILEVEPESDLSLWLDNRHHGLKDRMLANMIFHTYGEKISEVQTLVVIAHQDHGFSLALNMADRLLRNRPLRHQIGSISYGEACMLDITKGVVAKF